MSPPWKCDVLSCRRSIHSNADDEWLCPSCFGFPFCREHLRPVAHDCATRPHQLNDYHIGKGLVPKEPDPLASIAAAARAAMSPAARAIVERFPEQLYHDIVRAVVQHCPAPPAHAAGGSGGHAAAESAEGPAHGNEGVRGKAAPRTPPSQQVRPTAKESENAHGFRVLVERHGPDFWATHVRKVARRDGPTMTPVLHDLFQRYIFEEKGEDWPVGKYSGVQSFRQAAKAFFESAACGLTAVHLGDPKGTAYKAKTGQLVSAVGGHNGTTE